MLKFLKRFKKFFVFLIIFFFFIFLFSQGHIYKQNELKYGVTFSKQQAQSLGLNWQAVYQAIFSELGVKKIRLAAYWDEIETDKGKFFWDDIDWQINTASAKGASIILAVGARLPRWPECHFPEWTNKLSEAEKESQTLNYIQAVIDRYKSNNIIAWQVENEPFLYGFGECPVPKARFIDEEIALVRSLDNRPIVMTDSGELSLWYLAAKRADIFGTSIYRDTYSKTFKRYIHYPITPEFFRFKKNVVNMFAYPKKWIVIELQAEPWGKEALQNLSQEERAKTMTIDKFREILEFSRQAGFKEFYLWGAEYWYWEREKNNNPAYWEEAKGLFRNQL